MKSQRSKRKKIFLWRKSGVVRERGRVVAVVGGGAEEGNCNLRERRQGNMNWKQYVFRDLQTNSEFITLGVVTFGVTINA